MSNWCRAQQDDEKKQLMHALEQLKNDIRLDTETNYNWEAAMHVNVAIQKVNLTLVANTLKLPTVLTGLARGVHEFPAGGWASGDGAAKYYRAGAVKEWMETVVEIANGAIWARVLLLHRKIWRASTFPRSSICLSTTPATRAAPVRTRAPATARSAHSLISASRLWRRNRAVPHQLT